MNDAEHKLTPHDQLLAKLALVAGTGKSSAKGAKPNAEDLAMLIDDQLDFKRKKEVMSHINADPVLFEQWMQLVDIVNIESPETATAEAKTGFFAWLTNWQTLASGIAIAGIASVLIIQLPNNELSPSIETQQQTASTEFKTEKATSPFVSPDKRAIAAGIKAFLKQTNEKLNSSIKLDNAANKEESSLTGELYESYFQLGKLVAVLALDCRKRVIPADSLLAHNKLIEKLKQESFIPISQTLADIKPKMSLTQVCTKINHFLTLEI